MTFYQISRISTHYHYIEVAICLEMRKQKFLEKKFHFKDPEIFDQVLNFQFNLSIQEAENRIKAKEKIYYKALQTFENFW
jgi:hypothetical protein